MTIEAMLLPGANASLVVQRASLALVGEIADTFLARFDYTLPYRLKLQFVEEFERPNDYREHIMYLSLFEGEIGVGEKTFQVKPWALDKTVIAHEFAHFVFWDQLARKVVTKSAPNVQESNPNTEFHMVQEGFCDYMSAVTTGVPAIGSEAFVPPLRDLTDWDFKAHAKGVSPQFMGWGPFLWWLHTHLVLQAVVFEKIVLNSVQSFQRGDGLDAAVQSLKLCCERQLSPSDCARLQDFIQSAYLERFKPAFAS